MNELRTFLPIYWIIDFITAGEIIMVQFEGSLFFSAIVSISYDYKDMLNSLDTFFLTISQDSKLSY